MIINKIRLIATYITTAYWYFFPTTFQPAYSGVQSDGEKQQEGRFLSLCKKSKDNACVTSVACVTGLPVIITCWIFSKKNNFNLKKSSSSDSRTASEIAFSVK